MKDLIDRQAAIDAVKNADVVVLYHDAEPVDEAMEEAIAATKRSVTTDIEQLPSAQPDRSCIDQIKWERDTAIQQLNELGYGFGEAIRHDKDVISRKGAINAVCTVLYPDSDKMNDAKKVLKEMPSTKPDCADCKKHGGDWECDYNTCHKGKDTIYRRAAIDGVKTLHEVAWKNWHEPTLSANVVIDMIKDLPSEQPEVIRCKDCKDYQTDWETSYPNRHYCATMDSFMPEDGFCNYAERREE